VVTKDVPDGVLVGGVPAKQIATLPELIEKWQKDMIVHPEQYYDQEHFARPPSTPYDDLVTWRKEGTEIQSAGMSRTGTPFDYLIEAKQMKKDKK